MAMNPLGVSQSGMQIPGMNTQPYPSLGPAQGGVGPGADAGAPPEETADEARQLALIAQMQQMLQLSPDETKGALVGSGLQSILKQLRGTKKPRGQNSDIEQLLQSVGGGAGGGMQPQPAPMPPGIGATPMPPITG